MYVLYILEYYIVATRLCRSKERRFNREGHMNTYCYYNAVSYACAGQYQLWHPLPKRFISGRYNYDPSGITNSSTTVDRQTLGGSWGDHLCSTPSLRH